MKVLLFNNFILLWSISIVVLGGSGLIVNCAKILGIFPLPANSHYTLGRILMRGLAERGHDVTMISPFSEKVPPKGGSYRDIILDIQPVTNNKDMNPFEMAGMNPLMFQIFMDYTGCDITERTFNDSNVQKFLKSKDEQFDVVIVEQFINDAHKVFAHHFNAPLILFSTFGSSSWLNPLIGNPAPPSYIAEVMTPPFNPHKFWHRLRNTVVFLYGELYRHLVFFPKQNRILKKYFPTAPDLNQLNYGASLVLLNSHISTNVPVPRVPNMIDIGGYHVEPKKPLPKDLQEYLDQSTNGVIYFSMGSVLKSANLPINVRIALLKIFARQKMNILWKWEEEVLPNQPANVKLGKWLPQSDILAHPNVKLFITHGGLLSSIETVYHGVPLLAMPVFGDQVQNAQMATSNGYGLYLPYVEFSEKAFEDKLNEILSNPKYRENVKKRSELMHDRPVPPLDLADYWIKYVIRHKGAKHLRVAGLDLPWYQYLSLDVAAFLILVLTITIYLILKGIKCTYRILYGRKCNTTNIKRLDRKKRQ